MLQKKKYCFWLIAATIGCQHLLAQVSGEIRKTDTVVVSPADSLVTVGEILITGNKRTKAIIILREIPFKSGEKYTLEALIKKFEDARRQLMNTALFHSVVV
ncbi:MAG TPA: POTRA domain-containing protein, partial [Chitinophagaceae bacterium]